MIYKIYLLFIFRMKYSRQEKFLKNLEEFDDNFQEYIKDKKIVIVGCGGIGSVLGELLVRGGFLNLVLIDNDLIDETNIQRQNFVEKDIGHPKSKILRNRLEDINKDVDCEFILNVLDESNINQICDKCDLIIDCSDNFEIRRIINQFCENKNKVWIYNGAVKSQIMTCIFYGKDKLFSKVFSNKVSDESCCEVGVLASTTFTSASIAYNQVLKYFLGIKENKLIKLDIWNNKLTEVNIK